jgi:hypothetical protein
MLYYNIIYTIVFSLTDDVSAVDAAAKAYMSVVGN